MPADQTAPRRSESITCCSENRGDSRKRLDGNGLPSGFGYPIMIDPWRGD
jgi:hypothetical protein